MSSFEVYLRHWFTNCLTISIFSADIDEELVKWHHFRFSDSHKAEFLLVNADFSWRHIEHVTLDGNDLED